MSTRSNVLRLAVFGLLITRAPRSVQRVVAFMMLGVAIAVIWIVLGVAARSEPRYDPPQYWPSYQQERIIIVPRARREACPLDGPGAWECKRPDRPGRSAPPERRSPRR